MRCSLIIVLLGLVGSLFAFELVFPDGSNRVLEPLEIRNHPLQDFETKRDKDGAYTVETWSGISLLPWLEKQYSGSWQSLRAVSKDNYVVHFNRLELSTDNFFLACKLNGEILSEYDQRVIHTAKRESSWVRNLAALCLEEFEPLAQPRQIGLWENTLQDNALLKANNGISLEDLSKLAFGLPKGEILLLDNKMNKIRLEIPGEMDRAFLDFGDGKALLLTGKGESLHLSEIIYLQAGQTALITQSGLPKLREISKALSWTWEGKSLFSVKSKRKQLKPGRIPAEIPVRTWLELE